MSDPTPEERAARLEDVARATVVGFPALTDAQRERLTDLHRERGSIHPSALPPEADELARRRRKRQGNPR